MKFDDVGTVQFWPPFVPRAHPRESNAANSPLTKKTVASSIVPSVDPVSTSFPALGTIDLSCDNG